VTAPPSLAPGPLASAAAEVGQLLGFAVDTALAAGRSVVRRKLSWREFLDQTWFLAAVTSLPAVLVMIPLGVAVAITVGSFASQIGAERYSGAVVAFVVIGQAAPLVCALMISGVGGSAICSDLGARKIREETDALEVMGISPIERLVLPRVLAAIVVTVLLDGVVMAVGIGATLLFHVEILHGTPGSFLATLTQYARPADFVLAEVKAAVFAVIAAIVASYKGLTCKAGPQGVGDAVNESVVLSFILVFVANTAMTELYPILVPARGAY
jgi:phospholipid/cholesterol/gamma-HCH transport system permease protein